MTNDQKKEARWFAFAIVSAIIFVCIITFTAKYYYNQWHDSKKIAFMNQYISNNASQALLKWCKYYDFKKYWLEVFNMVMTESNGDRLARSHADCKGYTQLSKRTAQILKNRLKDKIKSCKVYDTEFNIAGGILHLRNLYDHYCSQDLWLSIEVYNVGDYNYFTRKKRAPFHMRRFGINQTYFEYEWSKYKRIWK